MVADFFEMEGWDTYYLGANATTARVLVFAAVFWAFMLGLLALDWAHSVPHNRFDEPLPWQLGHEKGESAGHCAAPLK
jgi:hypothetical protein